MTDKLKDLLINLHSKGRRYSYYPSLPDWKETNEKEFLIKSLNLKEVNLYIHIPFCESLCTFCGCNIKVTKSKGQFEPYILKILQEWNAYKENNPSIKINSIYLGGGTPTYLDLSELKLLIESIVKDTPLSEGFIGTIETDPRIEQIEKLKYLYSMGFDSLSIGVQDTNKETLKNVNRYQTLESIKTLVNESRSIGFKEINFDLIYGLPFQTKESFSKTINDVIALSPDRIANYPLAKVPWQMDMQNALGIYRPLGTTEMYDLYIDSHQKLEGSDYKLLGMGHYTLDKNLSYSRDITGYTRAKKSSLIALGTSAISNTGQYLYQNDKILEKYMIKPLSAIKTHLKTEKEIALENLFESVNCEGKFNLDRINSFLEEKQLEKLQKNLQYLENNGILDKNGNLFNITSLGKHFNKTICQTIEMV